MEAMTLLPCVLCNRMLPMDSFHKATNKSRMNRHTRCKKCQSASDTGRVRGIYRPENNWGDEAKARKRNWATLNRKSTAHKSKARRAVRNAISSGRISPPDKCQQCGSSPTARDGRRLIQGHHHAGYERALDVQWLCPKCHAKAERGTKG